MKISRRRLLQSLFCAPAIVAAGNIMRIQPIVPVTSIHDWVDDVLEPAHGWPSYRRGDILSVFPRTGGSPFMFIVQADSYNPDLLIGTFQDNPQFTMHAKFSPLTHDVVKVGIVPPCPGTEA